MSEQLKIKILDRVPSELAIRIMRLGLGVAVSVCLLLFSSIDDAAFAGTATLSWTAPTTNTDGTPLTNLAGFKVYYGTSPGSYGAPINVGNVTSYPVTGLGSGTYYFAVTAYDASGSESGFSNEGSKTFVAVLPVISAITVQNITASGAVITWTTDVPSSSQVQYGATTAYGANTVLDSSLVTSHSQPLSGLQASTLYHFRVWSVDAGSNVAISGDNTFTTLAAVDTTPPVISGVTASNLTSTGAVVTWITNEASNTQVDYGTTTSYGSSTTLNSTPVTSHSQTLGGLASATLYHYRVKSRDAANNLATSGDFTFTTTSTLDTTAPVISNVAAASVTTTGATVTWTTNEAATSQVDYGLTSGYGSSTTLNSTLVTGHSQTLSGLTASTTYHYRVRSADGSNNMALSADLTFVTASASDTTPPGDPQQFTAVSGNRQVVLTWTNPSDADFVGVRIRYRTDQYPTGIDDGTLLGDFTGRPNAEMVTYHTGLQNGVTYYYSASSYDLSGNFQSTAHASATPALPDSGGTAAAGGGGGCGGGAAGFIGRNKPPGPGQMADLLVVLAIGCGVLLRKKIRGLIPVLTMMPHVWHNVITSAVRTTVHLGKESLGVRPYKIFAQPFYFHRLADGGIRLSDMRRWRQWRSHQQWSWRRHGCCVAELEPADHQYGWNTDNGSCRVQDLLRYVAGQLYVIDRCGKSDLIYGY